MKWNKQKLVISAFIATALLIFAQASYANPNSQTHSLDTKGSDGCYFKLDNDSGLWFDAENIYLGDANGLWNWIDDDEIQFYNLRMGESVCPNPWHISIDSSVNVTVNKLFELDTFDATISGVSGNRINTEIYCGDYGKPVKVSGANSWSYVDSLKTVSCYVTPSSDADLKISWRGTSALGVYPLTISVLQEGSPIFATVDIDGENKTVFGPTTFTMPYGEYFITAFCGGQNQTKQTLLSGPQSIDFNFEAIPIKPPSIDWANLLFIPFFLVGVVLIYFVIGKKGKSVRDIEW